jgi:ubiquinone/menaquinone biosynthesis C-methylase UbiE
VHSHFEVSPAEYEKQRQGHLHRRRADLVARDVAALARPGDLVLEVGCGPGDILAAVARPHPDIRFLGVDVDDGMIEHARATHSAANVEFESLDISVVPLEARARVVFAIDVVHHVHDLDRFVGAVAGVLVRGGRWTVIEPNSRNPYIWLHQERMRRAGLDEAHFDRGQFERALVEHGLMIRERSTAFVVPGALDTVPRALAAAERRLERVPVLGGSVLYRIEPA